MSKNREDQFGSHAPCSTETVGSVATGYDRRSYCIATPREERPVVLAGVTAQEGTACRYRARTSAADTYSEYSLLGFRLVKNG